MKTCLPLLSSALTFASLLGAQTPIVGIWRLDETTGLVATDSGPFGNNGTLNGYGVSGSWVPGQFANGLQFDGIDDYVDLTGSTGLPIYQGDGAPFSVSFWVKAPPQDDDRVYSEGEGLLGTNGGGLFTLGSGRTSNGTTDKLQVYIRSSQPVAIVQEAYSVTPVFDDQWHHVVYVDNAGDAALYVDGVLDAGSFDYRNNTNGTQTANFGEFNVDTISIGAVLRSNVVAHMNGTVDEVHIFRFILSAADVQALMSNTLPQSCRASLGEFGVGCSNSTLDLTVTGNAMLGGPGFTLQLQAGPPNAFAIMLFGGGPIRRLDLGPIGFPTCTSYVASTDSFGVGVLDAAGASRTIPLAIPNMPTLACGQLNFQGATLDLVAGTASFSDVVLAVFGN